MELAAPLACGVKVTENGKLCPDAMVTGKAIPLRVNAELSVLPADTVTLPPLALRLPAADPLLPTSTVPTLNASGLTVSSVGVGAVVVTLPVSVTFTDEFEASLAIVRVAVNDPVASGVIVMPS